MDGWSDSTSGTGVRGLANATSGTTYGVYGGSDSTSGTGVYGTANATSGTTYGVLGWNNSTSGRGVYGYASATSGGTYGGYFESASAAGTGVYGEAGGSGVGVKAKSEQGNIIEGYNASQLVFKVDNDGNVFADGTYQSPAADFAEMWPAAPGQRSRGAEEQGSNPPCTHASLHLCSGLEPGDVLALGPDGGVMLAGLPDAGPVVGVYATQPGFLGGQLIQSTQYAVRNTQHATHPHIPVALVGIVPVKVSVENGPIRPGDLLGLSSTPGVAARARPVSFGGWRFYLAGSFFAKALEPAQDSGAIRVLLILH